MPNPALISLRANLLRAAIATCRLSCLQSCLLSTAMAADATIWIEGESAQEREITANHGLEAVVPDELSGGAWVASFANKGQATGTATYAADIPDAGTYHLWVRGTGALACRVDVSAWITGGKPVDLMAISASGNPGWPTIAWTDLGAVDLTAGKHSITWRLGADSGDTRFGAIDCFVFASSAFTPHGKWKPGTASAPTPAFPAGTTWDFAPGKDTLDPGARLDLSDLNEKIAGENGFVRVSPDGTGFVRGDGQPLRLWGIGLRTAYLDTPLAELQHTAHFLAKRGINVARIFVDLPAKKTGPASAVDEAELDRLFRLVAAFKSAGIYSIVDPYWGSATKLQSGWDVTSPGGNSMAGLVFFDAKAQAAYHAWLTALLDRKNPYTGIRLADDPALAILQLQNEDNLLWWTFHGIKGDALMELRKLYAAHITQTYGSFAQAVTAWKGYPGGFPADDAAAGLPGFVNLWDLTGAAMVQKAKIPGYLERTADQLAFICGLERAFDHDTIAWLRKDLGVTCPINADNWQVVDMTTVMDAENDAHSEADVMALNFYNGGPHFGLTAGWAIAPGDRYGDDSCALKPQSLPSNLTQVQGKPTILSEALWTPPNLYQSEAPLMVAGQMGLTGLAAVCWFSNVPEEWSASAQSKWTWSTPMQLGQFPAAALIQRKGYVKLGSPAIVEHRSQDDLWNRRLSLITQGAGWDPNRQTGIERPDGSKAATLDALAYLVGPVRLVFDDGKSQVADLGPCIDRNAKIVRADTGEIETDYGRGVYRINAPCAQAAAGFLGAAGVQHLADVEITCSNRYAAVSVVSLDGKPLRISAKILVQIGTLARPTGWSTVPAKFQFEQQWVDGSRIVSVGALQWQVENVEGSVRIANAGLSRATALDANGMALATAVDLHQDGGAAVLTLPEGTLYVILEGAKDR